MPLVSKTPTSTSLLPYHSFTVYHSSNIMSTSCTTTIVIVRLIHMGVSLHLPSALQPHLPLRWRSWGCLYSPDIPKSSDRQTACFVGCWYLRSGNVQVLLAYISHAIIQLHQLQKFERITVSNLIPLQTPICPRLIRHPRNTNVSTSHSKELLSVIHNTQQEAELIDDIMSFCSITLTLLQRMAGCRLEQTGT